MAEPESRRPLKIREVSAMQGIARWLSRRSITPNQISVGSVVCALLAAGCLLDLRDGVSPWSAWAAALFIQCRLLCNLFDGMVAVEGGKSTPAGELFNDIPDRIADPVILVAAGYAVTTVPWGSDIGWLAGVLAVMTAYVRTLATAVGAPTQFSGPMAKQHRMAVMTLATLLTPLEYFWYGTSSYSILLALIVICAGCVLTVAGRTRAAFNYLEGKPALQERRDV
jgi:phosphatidylglycerophosphate synthase